MLLCVFLCWASGSWNACGAVEPPQPLKTVASPDELSDASLTADQAYKLASGHYQRQRWLQAAEGFQRLIDLHPDDPRAATAHFYAGESHMQLTRYADALPYYTTFLALAAEQAPHKPRALFRRGQAAMLVGQSSMAEKDLSQFVQSYPADALRGLSESYLGRLAADQDRWADADRHYRLALQAELSPEIADACRLGLARCVHETGKLEEAERFYRLILHSRHADLANQARLYLGRLEFERRRFVAATELLESLAKLADHELAPQASFWLGHSLRGQERWRPAAAVFQRGANANPKHPLAAEMAYFAARALHQAGDEEGCAALLDNLDQRWPTSIYRADATADRVMLAVARGDESLVQQAHAMLQQWPEHPRAWAVRRELARELIQRRAIFRGRSLYGAGGGPPG